MFRMKITLFDEGGPVAEAEAEDPRLIVPPKWLAEDRTFRDDELQGWVAEAAAVWLDGCWECYPPDETEPVPGPEQQGFDDLIGNEEGNEQ